MIDKSLLIGILMLLLLPATAFAATGTVEHLVQEPIFGGQAYLIEAGRGKSPTLLLVHGLGDQASDCWRTQISELAADYHVLAVDLPGFGRSEKRNALYSPGSYAAYLRWVADRFAPGPLVVVGHSLGGAVALRFAADYPQDVQRLVLVDVAGLLHRNVITRDLLEPNLRRRIPQLPGETLGRIDSWIGGLIGRLPGLPVDIDQILANEALRGRFLAGDPSRIAALALVHEDFSRPLRQVQAPAVILWGTLDQVTPLRTGRLLEAVLPRARLQTIPGAGHVPMTDQPQLFRLALRQALTSPLRLKPPVTVGERVGICRDRNGAVFSGAYARIEIVDCSDVEMSGISATEVTITRSRVVIDQGTIRGDETALRIVDSVVTATGLLAEGKTALIAAGSRLDLAGVTLLGRSAAIQAETSSTVLFSVSLAESAGKRRYLHGLQRLAAGQKL